MDIERTWTGRFVDWLLRYEHQDEHKAMLRAEIARLNEKTRIQKERIARREQRLLMWKTVGTYRYGFRSGGLVDCEAIIELQQNGLNERKIDIVRVFKKLPGGSRSLYPTSDPKETLNLFKSTKVYTDTIQPWQQGLYGDHKLRELAANKNNFVFHG